MVFSGFCFQDLAIRVNNTKLITAQLNPTVSDTQRKNTRIISVSYIRFEFNSVRFLADAQIESRL